MDNILFDLIAESFPKFNERIVQGLAVEEMRHSENFIHQRLLSAAKDFPPELRYEGLRRLDPQQEYNELSRKAPNRSGQELARSDLYMIEVMFSFNGEKLQPRYIQIPFVGPGGLMYLRGSLFSIAPVLTDQGMSVGLDFIFVPLGRAKLTFRRSEKHFYIDDKLETRYVVWSALHNTLAQRKTQIAINKSVVRRTLPAMALYLFAKFGVYRTFAQYASADVVVGNSTGSGNVPMITPETYPPSQWVICRSSRQCPLGVHDNAYVGTDVRLAIPRKQFTHAVQSLVAGFYYTVDCFPHKVQPEYIGQEGEERMWRILLGYLNHGDGQTESKLLEQTEMHLDSFDRYLDKEHQTDLQQAGLYCEDPYDLLAEIMFTFAERVAQSTLQLPSMYDKRLDLLRYVFSDLVVGINNFMFAVKPKPTARRAITRKDVESALTRYLKPDTAVKKLSGNQHGEVNSIAAAGDNMVFKVTSQLIPQSRITRQKRGESNINPNDPATHLHVSIAEVGSYNTMTKAEPTGRSKINPWTQLAPDGRIARNEEFRPLLDAVQTKLMR